MERLATMSEAEMAQRWRDMRPRYIRFLAFFVLAAAGLFFGNRCLGFNQTITNFANVAFQIFSVFIVLFLVLTVMSLYYGRAPAKQST